MCEDLDFKMAHASKSDDETRILEVLGKLSAKQPSSAAVYLGAKVSSVRHVDCAISTSVFVFVLSYFVFVLFSSCSFKKKDEIK